MKLLVLILSFVFLFIPIWEIATTAEAHQEKEEGDEFQLDVSEAREKALENSPEAEKVRIQLEQLDTGVEMAENQHSQLENLQDDVDEFEEDLEEMLTDPDLYDEEDLEEEVEEAIEEFLEEIGEATDEVDDEIIESLAELFITPMENLESEIEYLGFRIISALDDLDIDSELEDLVLEAEQAKRELKQQRDTAQLEWEQGQEQIKFQAEAMYVGILMLHDVMDFLDRSLDVMEEQVNEIKTRKEVGETVELELDAVKLEKEQLQQQKRELETQYNELRREFSKQIGKSLDTQYELKSVEPDKEEYQTDKLVSELLEDGKEVEILEQELKFAEENEEWAEDNHGFYSTELDMAELETEMAEHKLETGKTESEQVLLNVYDTHLDTKSQLELSEQAEQLQEEYFEGMLIQEELGMVADIEVLSDELDKEETELLNNIAELQLYLSEQQLEYVQKGFLTENLLDELDIEEMDRNGEDIQESEDEFDQEGEDMDLNGLENDIEENGF